MPKPKKTKIDRLISAVERIAAAQERMADVMETATSELAYPYGKNGERFVRVITVDD